MAVVQNSKYTRTHACACTQTKPTNQTKITKIPNKSQNAL